MAEGLNSRGPSDFVIRSFVLLLLCHVPRINARSSVSDVRFVGYLSSPIDRTESLQLPPEVISGLSSDEDNVRRKLQALIDVEVTEFHPSMGFDFGLSLDDKCDNADTDNVAVLDVREPFQGNSLESADEERHTFQLLVDVQQGFIEKKLRLCFKQKLKRFGEVIKWTDRKFLLPKVNEGNILNADALYLNGVQRASRHPRQATEPTGPDPRIVAIKLLNVNKDLKYTDDGHIEVLKGKAVKLEVIGIDLKPGMSIKLTTAKGDRNATCRSDGNEVHILTPSYSLEFTNDEDYSRARVDIPSGVIIRLAGGDDEFFVCLGEGNIGDTFIHQGTHESLRIGVYDYLLPIWLMIIFIVVLLCLSGLFSGLNLGLMALDQTELKIVQNTGTEKEKKYANKISPIRAHGNFLLCSLLLGNVLVNNTLTILLDTLTSGIVAIIGATLGIVIFGEIIPQAICSRHGLAVGAYTIWLTKFFMLLTFPLSFPISKLLDKILGAEIGTVYNRERLMELLKVTNEYNDLEKDELDIVSGALRYKQKTVRHVMTGLEDCFLLPSNTILNFDTIAEIREQGYSRIPVYDGDRNNIVHVLFAKDLMFIDPDDNMPVNMVCEFYQNKLNFVFHDTPLDEMFNDFKTGDKGHMAFVQDVNNTGDGDPFYETIGLVTLEDIIEEIIQQEIVDETDVITDNRTKKKRYRAVKETIPTMANQEKRLVAISPQMTLAVFQYLTTSVEPFKNTVIAEPVLKRLLSLDIFKEIKIKKEMAPESFIIIEKGKPVDYFILIIEGRVEVNIGQEELVFESGPFTYFCVQAFNQLLSQGLNPPSPVNQVNKAVTTPSSLNSSVGLIDNSTTTTILQPTRNLRKASTHNSFDVAAINKRSNSNEGHMFQRQNSTIFQNLPAVAPFVPDYTVKAVTDVLFLKIKKNTYIQAVKASLMTKKQSGGGGEINDKELDRLLEKVNEDDDLMITMRTPTTLRSPDTAYAKDESPNLTPNLENARRSSLRSSLSALKKAIIGNDSEPNNAKAAPDDFWGEDGDTRSGADSGVQTAGSNGPPSLPVPTLGDTQHQVADSGAAKVSDGVVLNVKPSSNEITRATVISVKGSEQSSETPQSDRTSSLLPNEPSLPS